MFCLITASKLSSQYFKVKVMRLKPDYLLKSFLLYSKCETLFVAPNAYWADSIALSLDILLLRGVSARPCFACGRGVVNTCGVMRAHATA